MKIPYLEFPKQLNFRTLDAFRQTLESYEKTSHIGIDFRAAKWGPPFFLTAAAISISEQKARTGQRMSCINFEHCSYFAHMGFFKSFGLPFGRSPGEAKGNDNYLPINIINSEEIRKEAHAKSIAVGLLMEIKAERLAKILSRSEEGVLVDALTFSIREMFRNIIEHSEADRIAYCAQAYPNKGHVEVGIFDVGIGLRSGLEENKKLRFQTNSEAIRCALMPGVSGKAEKVKKLRMKDEWTNSGYGLYMTSRLFRDHGSFSVGSGDAAIFLSGADLIPAPWKMKGTAIRLVLEVDKLTDLEARLNEYKREGARLRQQHGGMELAEPSVASTTLARNFAQRRENRR